MNRIADDTFIDIVDQESTQEFINSKMIESLQEPCPTCKTGQGFYENAEGMYCINGHPQFKPTKEFNDQQEDKI